MQNIMSFTSAIVRCHHKFFQINHIIHSIKKKSTHNHTCQTHTQNIHTHSLICTVARTHTLACMPAHTVIQVQTCHINTHTTHTSHALPSHTVFHCFSHSVLCDTPAVDIKKYVCIFLFLKTSFRAPTTPTLCMPIHLLRWGGGRGRYTTHHTDVFSQFNAKPSSMDFM